MSISTKEQANSLHVLDLLYMISDINFTRVEGREDLFIVTEPETELELLIDVEDDIVVLAFDLGDVRVNGNVSPALAEYLLNANSSSVHGAFGLVNGHLYLKCNLQAENLDLNELYAAIQSMFYTIDGSIETISTLVKE